MATHKFWDDPMSEPAEKRRKWHEVAKEAWNRRCEPKQELEFDYGSED